MRLIDVSHTVLDGMTTYPGLPGPVISDHLSREASRASYSPGTEFQIGRIEMVANTGTYLDTPAHRFADGWDLAELPLERVAHVPLTLVPSSQVTIGDELVPGVGQVVVCHSAIRAVIDAVVVPVRGRHRHRVHDTTHVHAGEVGIQRPCAGKQLGLGRVTTLGLEDEPAITQNIQAGLAH